MSEILITDGLSAILTKTANLPGVISADAEIIKTDDFLQELKKVKPNFPKYPAISASWAGMAKISRVRGSGPTADIKRTSLYELIVLTKDHGGRANAVSERDALMEDLFFGLCYQDFGFGGDADLSMVTGMRPFRVNWDKSVAGGVMEIDLAWENQVTNTGA